eukprot:1158278-Prymnesium_polylepis.1
MLTDDTLRRTPHHLAAQSGRANVHYVLACLRPLAGEELLDGRGYSVERLTSLGSQQACGTLS